MKKIPRRLVVRSETVRALDDIDLMRARGGSDPAYAEGDRTQSGINYPASTAVVGLK
jgi:hypothetical protein